MSASCRNGGFLSFKFAFRQARWSGWLSRLAYIHWTGKARKRREGPSDRRTGETGRGRGIGSASKMSQFVHKRYPARQGRAIASMCKERHKGTNGGILYILHTGSFCADQNKISNCFKMRTWMSTIPLCFSHEGCASAPSPFSPEQITVASQIHEHSRKDLLTLAK